MRVLVTRPLHSGERTAEKLRKMGHEPLLLPLSQPLHDAPQALRDLSETEGAIAITSAEAIRAIADRPDDLARHLNRPLFAVGEASAEEAEGAGFRRVTASSGNGADLAEMIAGLGHSSVIYLAGAPRAATFETRAKELGIHLTVAECYTMQPLEIAAPTLRNVLTDQSPHAILFYSRQAVEWFFNLPDIDRYLQAMSEIRLLCLGKLVAEAVPADLRKKVMIAATPDEPSLFSLI